MSRESRRAAFGRCPETCPLIDKAFDRAFDDIMYVIEASAEDLRTRSVEKEVRHYLDTLRDFIKTNGTEKLRDALDECEAERLDFEEKLDVAEAEIEDLQATVADLESVIEEQRATIDQAGTL